MAANLGEIARRIGAEVSVEHESELVERLLTDSRSLANPVGTLFFALHTDTGDGHFYLQSLYAQGVRYFVVERVPEQMRELQDAVWLVVPDAIRALQQAGRPEPGFSGKRIAVSGSRGKTVVKEWLYMALRQLERSDGRKNIVTRSPRSYNSQTGVPLSLWEVSGDADYAIIETGISRRREMEVLNNMVNPDIAIFTSLDAETHAEGFKNISEKSAEKALMARNAKVVVYNADNETLATSLRQINPDSEYAWSRQDSNATLFILKESREENGTHLEMTWRGLPIEFHVPFSDGGEVEDAIAVFATLLALGYSPDSVIPIFETLKPVRTRLDVMEGINGCTVAVDGYFSDLESLPGALEFMDRHSSLRQPRTLIIGDLYQALHDDYEKLARFLTVRKLERVIAIGPEMMGHQQLFPAGSKVFSNVNELLGSLSAADFSGEYVMIKGTPGDGLDRIADMLAARKHETVLEVNLGALARNYAAYKRRLPEGTRITAMVKAEAYGMGSYEVARTLQDAGADFLAVAVLDEGLELRRRGITMPIMVMNPKVVNYRSMFANRLEPEIYSSAMLDEVIAEAARNGMDHYPVHIKLDTGMHRTGFGADELESLCRALSTQKQVEAASVFSHLATADCLDMDDYTLKQIETFKEMTAYMTERLPKPFMRHILNSAGMVRFPQYAFDMGRLGIGLYGVNTLPSPVVNPLEPVATLRTAIIALRDVEPGETVGYGRKGVVSRPSRIATLPIGYADGFNRHFGCGAVNVLVRGKEAPTIGNICMDQCMIDVTGIDCKVGDEVEIFGSQLHIERLAKVLDTIPYEILTSISPRVKRLYFRE